MFRCLLLVVNISEPIVLCALKDNKVPGPDSIHSYILKTCATLCTMLYRQSLTSEDLPSDWKKAHVILFKKYSRFKATNYKPISLTSTVVKILESTICTELLNCLIENSIQNESPDVKQVQGFQIKSGLDISSK